MKSATIPTVVAGAALAGVLVLFFQQLDSEPAPSRQESGADDDASVRIAALEMRIRQLEQQVEALGSYRPEEPETQRPLKAPEPDEVRPPNPEVRPEPRSEADRTARRTSRQSAALDRLVADSKIGKLTTEQMKQVEVALDDSRKKMVTRFAEIRDDPANEGIEREQRMELVRTEFATLRQDFENELAAFLPASDAQVIAQELFTNRGGRNRGRGRRGRGGNR